MAAELAPPCTDADFIQHIQALRQQLNSLSLTPPRRRTSLQLTLLSSRSQDNNAQQSTERQQQPTKSQQRPQSLMDNTNDKEASERKRSYIHFDVEKSTEPPENLKWNSLSATLPRKQYANTHTTRCDTASTLNSSLLHKVVSTSSVLTKRQLSKMRLTPQTHVRAHFILHNYSFNSILFAFLPENGLC